MIRLLTILLASAAGILGQSTVPVNTGSVSGHVLDTDTNLPVIGVKVTAEQEDRRGGVSANTDSEGRYVIANLPAGRRSIEVYDGNLGPSMTAPQFVMISGSRDIQVDFHTRLFSEVSGRVLDEAGNPIVGMQVSAVRRMYNSSTGSDDRQYRLGVVQLVSVAARALTDDQGRYVLTTLPAGRQYWIAASSPKRYAVPISDAPADPQARNRTLAATYYPNSNSIDTATAIIPHSQEVRNDVDIRMSRTDSYCLETTLTDAGVPSRMQFLLVDEQVSNSTLPSVNLPGGSQSGSDGKIRLCDLYPGRFKLIAARLSAAAQESIGTLEVTITNKDVRNRTVSAISRSTVAGEVTWDKPPIRASSEPIRLQIYPSPVSSNLSLTVPGKFSLDVVEGTPYLLGISRGLDSHSYLKAITYGGYSILYQPFVPAGGDAKLAITLGSDAGSITATVRTANGQPAAGTAVIIVPVTARTESDVVSTFHAGITNEDGTYLESGLPPGKYDVFAAIDPPPNRIGRTGTVMLLDLTPEAIGKILNARARGKLVDVGPDGEASVSLTPIQMGPIQ